MADPSNYTREEVGNITIYTIYASDVDSIAVLLDDLFQHYSHHLPDERLLTLIDASRLVMKPYVVRQTILLSRQATQRSGCTAMILPKGYDAYVFRAMLRQIEVDPQVRRRAFFQSREEGLQWLTTCMD